MWHVYGSCLGLSTGMVVRMAMGAKGAMARNVDTASTVRLLAGRLCLDFVNTVDWRASAAPVELLGTYGDLLAWGV